MTRENLIQAADGFFRENSGNFVDATVAMSPEIAGMRIYEQPLFVFGAADDPLFGEMRRKEAVGPHFMTPEEWLPGAGSVVSFFLPFTERVRRCNAKDLKGISFEWLHARIEGQTFLKTLCDFLCETLTAEGFRAVTPCYDSRFWSKTRESEVEGHGRLRYTSIWSERHVAYVCGLGTFGLSAGLITEKGMSGRFGSVVTDCVFPPTLRPYTEYDQYCTRCGACIRNCPASAITVEGKDHELCWNYLEPILQQYKPRYGCGKCQVATPCESRNPSRQKEMRTR